MITAMALWRSKKTTIDPDAAADPAVSTDTGEPDAPAALTDRQASADSDAAAAGKSGGLFAKMRGALTKTRQALNTDIRDLFKAEGRLVDDEFLGELFARLVRTDMGVGPAEKIRDDVGTRLRARVEGDRRAVVRPVVAAALPQADAPRTGRLPTESLIWRSWQETPSRTGDRARY